MEGFGPKRAGEAWRRSQDGRALTIMPLMEAEMERVQARGWRGDGRLRRILHGSASSLLQRGTALLVSAISLPLTVRYLGAQRYGVWVTISTTVVMLAAFDLGISNTLTNIISKAYAADDRGSARRYYSTAFWMSTGLSLLLMLVAMAVWPWLNWAMLFHVTEPGLGREIGICAAMSLAFFLLSLPLNLVHRVLSGYQQTQITNYFLLMSNILGLLAIVVVVRLRGSLVMLTMVYSGTMLMGNVALNAWVNLWDRRWISPHPGAVSRGAVRSLLQSGLGFFILQIAGLIVFNSDNLVIAHYLGASEVAPYNVTWKLAGYAAILQTAIYPSLWPAYAEAYARRDYAWVRSTFWMAVKAAVGTCVLAMVVMVFVGRPLIGWYVGPVAVPTRALLYGICCWTVLSTMMEMEACLLAALNRVRLQGILSIIAAVLNLALSIFLVKRIGSLGVVLGTILSYLLTLVVPQSVLVWKVLYQPEVPVEALAAEQHA
jgi:O-antigen/teichoic acid export membrane protein